MTQNNFETHNVMRDELNKQYEQEMSWQRKVQENVVESR